MPASEAIAATLFLSAGPLTLCVFWAIYEVARLRQQARQEPRP